jgi:hypothetical protein
MRAGTDLEAGSVVGEDCPPRRHPGVGEPAMTTPAKPASLAPLDPRSTPLAALIRDTRWVGWSWELRRTKDGRQKWTKPPRQPGNGYARNDTAATWASFDAAWQAVQRGLLDGIGLELMGLPQETLVAIDLDDVRRAADGALLPWAAALVVQANSYCEITPSGCGLRILGTARGLPDTHCKIAHPDGGSFEVYVQSVRYICVTGHRFGAAPNALNDITAAIRALLALGGSRPNGGSAPVPGADDFIPGEDDAADAAAPIDLATLDPLIAEQISKGTINGVPAQKRGLAFFNLVEALQQAGHGFAEVLATLVQHPHGVHSKFAGRLEKELRRVWAKLDGATVAAEPVMPAADPETPWPDPIRFAGFHGLFGEIVAALREHTEADDNGLLLNLLIRFGNKIGRGPHIVVERTAHHTNLFLLIAGATSRARKDTSGNQIEALFGSQGLDPWLAERCVSGGLSSGEGLVEQVRDERWGTDDQGNPVLLDRGEPDKRLMLVESEFNSVLAVMRREGSTLAAKLRQAWDGKTLNVSTRRNKLRASNTLISLAAHCTIEELRNDVDRLSLFNGFLNRFLVAVVRRARSLPFGGDPDLLKLAELGARLDHAVTAARALTRLDMTDAARAVWEPEYARVTADQSGVMGAITARAEAQQRRLSLIYALADGSPVIEPKHVEAGKAVWEFCEASAKFVFGGMIGDPLADSLLTLLRDAGSQGLTRSELHAALHHNYSAARLQLALTNLLRHRRVRREMRITPHRPGPATEAWIWLP